MIILKEERLGNDNGCFFIGCNVIVNRSRKSFRFEFYRTGTDNIGERIHRGGYCIIPVLGIDVSEIGGSHSRRVKFHLLASVKEDRALLRSVSPGTDNQIRKPVSIDVTGGQ